MAKSLKLLARAALAGVLPSVLFASDGPAGAGEPGAQSPPGWTDMFRESGISVQGYIAASYYQSNGYP
jgi:hypothetical protein